MNISVCVRALCRPCGPRQPGLPAPPLQNDFFPGGAFPLPDAESVIPALNSLRARQFDIVIVCTLEHSLAHSSFASNNPVRGPPGGPRTPLYLIAAMLLAARECAARSVCSTAQ